MRWMTIAVLLLVSPGAYAQQPDAVTACLKTEGAAGSFGAKCIGLIADPCIKNLEGKSNNTPAETKACARRELTIWNGLMRAALAQVKTGGFKEIDGAVTAAQTAWSQSLTRLCPVFDKIDPGMAPGGSEYCQLQETARRVLLLRRLGEAVNEH